MIASNSLLIGLFGIVARVISNLENIGGLLEGNTQLPIRNGGVVDINNSPDTVNPKLL